MNEFAICVPEWLLSHYIGDAIPACGSIDDLQKRIWEQEQAMRLMRVMEFIRGEMPEWMPVLVPLDPATFAGEDDEEDEDGYGFAY